MSEFFLNVVNMSISASWIVLAVLVLRFLLKKAPKWIIVLLWGIVAVRLICPFSIESVMSLIPSAETITKAPDAPRPHFESGVTIIDNQVNDYLGGHYYEGVTRPTGHFVDITTVLAIVWLVGIVVLLAYTIISYFRVKNKIGTAVLLRDNVFQSENVVSPFVLGIIKPKIYLPFNMNEQDMEYVIAHENAHISRKDHLWKPFGFLVLTLHWFNPLMWLGYVLLCRDIELACDEKVVKEFNTEQKADYSQALLTCSVNRRVIAACPLAFGEVGVKDRVKSVLNYKKPAFWIILVAIIASVVIAACFLTNPISSNKTQMLLDVLNNERTFINESGDTVYLKNHRPFNLIDAVPEKYALVDLDGDSKEELVIHTTQKFGAYTVFHIYNKMVYGYDFSERGLIDLKEDGTFVESSGAGLNRYVALRFVKDKYDIIEQAYADDMNKQYRINGVSSTVEIVNEYIDEFYNKPDASWEKCENIAGFRDKNQNYKNIYKQFLKGEKTALDENGVAKPLTDYILADYYIDEYVYTFYDLTGDGIPELCVDAMPWMDFFTIKNGELHHWYTETIYGQLLNNGAILKERHGGAPEHINYEYYELDENASKKFSISFSWWDKTTLNGKEYPEFYEINGQEVSKKEYEEQTNKYLTIGNDKIVWYDKDDTPH